MDTEFENKPQDSSAADNNESSREGTTQQAVINEITVEMGVHCVHVFTVSAHTVHQEV